MRLVNEHLAGRRLDLSDGVKAYDERGWVQVLPDPDEPVVHLYAEGETDALTDELAAELATFIEGVVQGDAPEQRTLEQASS
jgi:mannose-1-phosphate guanylyltransferase/phosphomannomutase